MMFSQNLVYPKGNKRVTQTVIEKDRKGHDSK